MPSTDANRFQTPFELATRTPREALERIGATDDGRLREAGWLPASMPVNSIV